MHETQKLIDVQRVSEVSKTGDLMSLLVPADASSVNPTMRTCLLWVTMITHILAWIAFGVLDILALVEAGKKDVKVSGQNETYKTLQMIQASTATSAVALVCGLLVALIPIDNHVTVLVSGLVGSLAGSIFSGILAIQMIALDDVNSDHVFVLLVVATILKLSVFFTIKRNDSISQFEFLRKSIPTATKINETIMGAFSKIKLEQQSKQKMSNV